MSETITVHIKTSDKTATSIGFVWNPTQEKGNDQPVHFSGSTGDFEAIPGVEGMLAWEVHGDPGSSIKVTLSRNGVALPPSKTTKVRPSETRAYDARKVKVS